MEKKKKQVVLMDKYELGVLLGRGTFSKVYQARNVNSNQSCFAIKVVDKEKILKHGLINQIKTQISAMRLVRHPNVVQLHEVMASRSKIYFAMDYAKGGHLFDTISSGDRRLPEDIARRYFQQLISAVDLCHSHGVYHRDLKPQNLLLDDNGDLKVSGFGLSALHAIRREDGLLHARCGTPAYVAPEAINKKGYDGAKADIWSCGVILFILLAGYLPFQGINLMQMYRKIGKGRLISYPQWFSPNVKKLLSQILDPRPRPRITLAEIMDDPWFNKGFNKPDSNSNQEQDQEVVIPSTPKDVRRAFDQMKEEAKMEATSMNAFDIIAHASGFNLSNMFEENGNYARESRFSSKDSTATIVSKFEEIAKARRLDIMRKGGKVKLQSNREGRTGVLAVEVEIFEITPSLHMVELKKAAGDTLEYNKFCDRDLKPALSDIVWAWESGN